MKDIRYDYTDKEIKHLLENNLVMLVDTREKVNQHLTDYYDSKGIRWKSKKLCHGDYSAILEKDIDLGIAKDITFENSIVVERKNSLNELSANLTTGRKQFDNELMRSKQAGTKIVLMVEGASYDDIVHHRYPTQLNPMSYIASLRSFQAKYSNLHLEFTSKALAGNSTYYLVYYHIRNILKNRMVNQVS